MSEWDRARYAYRQRDWRETSPSFIDSAIEIIVAAFLIVLGGLMAIFMAIFAISWFVLSVLVYFSPLIVVGAVMLWMFGLI